MIAVDSSIAGAPAVNREGSGRVEALRETFGSELGSFSSPTRAWPDDDVVAERGIELSCSIARLAEQCRAALGLEPRGLGDNSAAAAELRHLAGVARRLGASPGGAGRAEDPAPWREIARSLPAQLDRLAEQAREGMRHA